MLVIICLTNNYIIVRLKTIAERLMAGDEDEEEEYDFRLPLSQLSVSAITDLKAKTALLSASNPKLAGFRFKDYEVNKGFVEKSSPLDEDISILGKIGNKAVVSTKFLEEMEKLVRQSILVASHAEWTLGSVICLMKKDDTPSVIRALESMNASQKHSAGLLARLLANVTNVRRDQFLATSAISSVAKLELAKLSVPLEGPLFQNKISEIMAKDAETSSRQALVSLANKLTVPARQSKPQMTLPKFNNMATTRHDPPKRSQGESSEFRPRKQSSFRTSKPAGKAVSKQVEKK